MPYPVVSPMLQANGLPLAQKSLPLNSRVSKMISYMTCGILTGWVAGQAPPLSNVPVAGYAMWLLWSGLSVFLPSQRDGKVTVTRQPPPQGAVGKPLTSDPVQGAPPKGLCCMLA